MRDKRRKQEKKEGVPKPWKEKGKEKLSLWRTERKEP